MATGPVYIPWMEVVAGLLIFLGGICIHELLHMLAWKFSSGKPFSAFKFGIDPKSLSPYAHCTESMAVGPYRLGGAAPGILVGILPYLIGLIAGDLIWALWGYLFTLAASGDWIVLWLLRNVPQHALVEDHPTRAGCTVISEK
jgi:hypothetical protein